jgi:carboxyl-terminal processing protease
LEPLEGYGSENFRYESDYNNALDDGANKDEAAEGEADDAAPAEDADADETAPAEGDSTDIDATDSEAPAEGEGTEEGDEEDEVAEEEPAEEFFDFQLVRAKDLIRGIAIFQN